MTQTSTDSAIPGQRSRSAARPRLDKAVIRNFRLLRATELSFAERVTVCVGRNNTGKTSMAKLFKLFTTGKETKLHIEDFSIDCYQEFLDALRLFLKGEREQALGRVPEISLALHIAYDKECGAYGALAPFVVDLDPDCAEVVIRFTYALKKEAAEAFFKDLPIRTTKRRKAEGDSKTLEQLAKRITIHFTRSVEAVDPTDESNVCAVDMTDVRKVLRVDFLDAQRGLDDEDRNAAQPIGAIFEQLFTAARDSKDTEWLQNLATQIDRSLNKTSSALDRSLQEVRKRVAPTLKEFGYPGLGNRDFAAGASLDATRLLKNFTRIHYPGTIGVRFPEQYSGLGSRNLVLILLKLYTYYREYTAKSPKPVVHLVFLEEPEAHLHPQMQEVFIRQLVRSATRFPELDATERAKRNSQVEESDDPWNAQFLVTTHSAHLANGENFRNIRYFRKEEESREKPVSARTDIRDLSQVKGERKWLHKYLTLTRADLYFADKAILVEGASERIFVPAAEEKLAVRAPGDSDQLLSHQYVTLMEVGGAYAHKFYPLLKELGIPTLIITDLDPVTVPGSNGRICPVSKAGATGNASIRKWFSDRQVVTMAELQQAAEQEPPVQGNMCLAYQVPEQPDAPCGRTFEDAFALANPALFGLPLQNGVGAPAAEEAAHKKVKGRRSKVDFALEYAIDRDDWEVPRYIERGLEWLMKHKGTSVKTGDE